MQGGPKKGVKQDAELPKSTRAAICADTKTCFWCCHRFDGEVMHLPLKVLNGNIMGIGCFCSLECAAAFNFQSREIMHDPWRSYELLNIVAKRNGLPVPVKQADSRFTLKMFRGPDDIAKFREFHKTSNSLPHPVVPLAHYLEDTYSSDTANKSTYVPLDNERVLKAKQNLMNYDHAVRKTGIHSKMNLA